MAHVGYKNPNNIDLNPSLYKIKDDEALFFKQMTGIRDDEELKQHIIGVQREAFAVFPYLCIKVFNFLSTRITKLPIYDHILRLGKERPGAILFDMACCFGNDARKAWKDGFPGEQIVAADINKEFFESGYKLFKDSPSTCPITFIHGDIFDDNFIAASELPTLPQGKSVTYPNLKSLGLTNSLNPLHGKISAIHAGLFFHLFTEEQQLLVAKKFASLLSPEPGSVICGVHAGEKEKGTVHRSSNGTDLKMFCHSKESFKEMWEKEVFVGQKVRVEVEYVKNDDDHMETLTFMNFVVERL